jgi:release factor glutamine methyltransferase
MFKSSQPDPRTTMQLKDVLRAAIMRLEDSRVGSSRLNAEILLMHTLGCDRAYLYAHPERELIEEELTRYDEHLSERARGVPSQYITGHQEFWGLDFLVAPGVLIPRPETEHLVEAVLELVRAQDLKRPRIVDVGTGSGCIAIALAHELPDADLYATDLSPEALEMAHANTSRLQAQNRIHFRQTDLLEGLPDEHFDVVASNPPYVGESESDKVQLEVRKFEPHMAVFGGAEGMDIYRRLIPQARRVLRPAGWLSMEIGYSQEQKVLELLSTWSEVRSIPDLQGIPRVVLAQKKS